jgi:hypothetical protein
MIPIKIEIKKTCNLDLDKCAYAPDKIPVKAEVTVILESNNDLRDVPSGAKKEVIYIPISDAVSIPIITFLIIYEI